MTGSNLLKRLKILNRDLIIREAIPSDASGFISLMNNNYLRQKDEKYFLWRFFSCPAPTVLYVIANRENKIIGGYGINVFTLTSGERCGLTVDLIVDKEYRRRGLLRLLENKIHSFAKKKSCSYLLCLTNEVGMKAHSKIEGWQILGVVPALILTSNLISKPHHITNFTLGKNTVSFKFDRPLLNWRFDKNPEYQYLHIKSGGYQSYIKIFKDPENNTIFGDIVYYTSPLASEPDFLTLIEKSVRKLQNLNAEKILTWANRKYPAYKLFISRGFIPQNQPRYICVKKLQPNAANPSNLDWQLLPSDSEVF